MEQGFRTHADLFRSMTITKSMTYGISEGNHMVHAALMFSMTMLLGTPQGDAHTFSALEQILRNAGFARNEFRELSPLPQRLVVSYR